MSRDPTIPGSKQLRRKYEGERRRAAAARRAEEEAREDAALRAKYAGLPPLPKITINTLAKAAGVKK